MRLKSEIWVQAYLRRCSSAGIPGVVVKRGQEDGGSIFIMVDLLDGGQFLFGPAPAGLDGSDTGRLWMQLLGPEPVTRIEITEYLDRQKEFDPDIWIVEIEDREGRHFLDDHLATS